MHRDFGDVLDANLGAGGEFGLDEVEALLRESTIEAQHFIEGTFGGAGWFHGSARPFEPPRVSFDAPQTTAPPTIEVERRLWLARFNPKDPKFKFSDIADDAMFPWEHPEAAPIDGWWLSTLDNPASRASIEEVDVGDLVICQRTDPGAQKRDTTDQYGTDTLIGICAVAMLDSWDDADTDARETRVCLVPLSKFTHAVPRNVARALHRLRGASFASPRQLPGRSGPVSYLLSAVDWDDAPDLLSVCGIPPEALLEPDTAVLAARLRASNTGNPLFLKLRYDAVLINGVRRVHERDAERRAEAWAKSEGYVRRQRFQHVANAGFDLLFTDALGAQLQVEVKGYATRRLRSVHLQPSQAQRAHDADAGIPPDWRLFVVLGAGSQNPSEDVFKPRQVVRLISNGEIQVKGGWPRLKASAP